MSQRHRRALRALVVLTLWMVGSLLPGAAAADRRKQDGTGWIELQSQHFTFYSEVSPRRTRRIALGLEGLRAMLGQLTGLELDNRVPTRIYVFSGERSFEPYKFLYQGRPAEIAGYFVSREQANYIAIDAENVDQARAVVYHEYVHEVLDNNFRDLPVWFNEGLAEYYSTFEIEGDEAAVGKLVVEHWQWFNHHDPLPMDVLLAVDRDSPIYNEGTRRGSFYAQSWALVHYLLVGNKEREGQVVEFLRQRRIATSQEEAFQRAFRADYAVLERELLRYLRRLDFPYLRVPVPDVDRATEIRDLAASEALVLLGDLLANQIDLRSEAEDHYRRALTLAPDHPQALAGLGYLAERRLDLETALDFYRQAHRGAPDDPLVLYRLAKLLLPRGESAADQARALLRRCVVLQPDFAPAWAHLSYAITFLDPLPEDTVGIGQTAFQLYPTRWDVALNLLNHYTRLGHREVAESMVDGYFRDLDQGAHLPQARELVIQMDLRQAHEAAGDNDLGTALAQLDALEARWGDHFDATTRRQVFELRSVLGNRRDTDRYNEAVLEINAGRIEEGRRLLEALILESPDGPVADGARRLLRRLALEFE